MQQTLQCADISGHWGIGVSGGADSVALLHALRQRHDLGLHVIHLNHEARGEASDADAQFVQSLAAAWQLPHTIARLSHLQDSLSAKVTNASARYRQARLTLFRQVIKSAGLAGVILAHHADDQAETILLRLLRGSGPAGLGGMAEIQDVSGVKILRPLLGISRQEIRDYLKQADLTWREDGSNQTPVYARNRVRRLLENNSELTAPLLALGRARGEYHQWVRATAPVLEGTFPAKVLASLPSVLQRESARQWLIAAGVRAAYADISAVRQLIEMACDATSPPRRHFPGAVRISRRHGQISAE